MAQIKSYKAALVIFLIIIVAINIYIFHNKKQSHPLSFKKAVQPGTVIDYQWAKSGKEILFWYVNPNCGRCIDNRSRINQLADDYSASIKTIGICSDKYLSGKDSLQNYNFKFITMDAEKFKALHLAYTPLAVMVENKKVTFSIEFGPPLEEELKRLEKYLNEKYDK
jgi:thiol-disulfide isomerase/thioredoxin